MCRYYILEQIHLGAVLCQGSGRILMVEDVQNFAANLFTCKVELYVHAVFCDTQCNSRWRVASSAVNTCTHVCADTVLDTLPAVRD
jgi:hypothetical protein